MIRMKTEITKNRTIKADDDQLKDGEDGEDGEDTEEH